MAICHLCPPGDQNVPDDVLLTHLRVLHPDLYEGVDLWPDGRPVIVDLDLQPQEFATRKEPPPVARISDEDAQRLADAQVRDEDARKAKLEQPQNAKEWRAMQAAKDTDVEGDN